MAMPIAAADAQRGEALLRNALLHFMQQDHQHARAGRADRMADHDRAAVDVDVDLGGIPAEVLVDRVGLRRDRCFMASCHVRIRLSRYSRASADGGVMVMASSVTKINPYYCNATSQ